MWFKKKEIPTLTVEKSPEFKPYVSMAEKGRAVTICESMCDKGVCAGDKGVLLAEVWNGGMRNYSFYSLIDFCGLGAKPLKDGWNKTWYMVRMDLDKKEEMIPKSNCRLDPEKPKSKKKRAKAKKKVKK